jgi:DNA damage-binding protein 1
MKSVQLLVFNSSERKFEVRARDFNPAWMTATMILDDQVYLGAESNYNIFSLKKNDDALREEDRCRLEVCEDKFHDLTIMLPLL